MVSSRDVGTWRTTVTEFESKVVGGRRAIVKGVGSREEIYVEHFRGSEEEIMGSLMGWTGEGG